MAESPAHKFGQIIGEVFEATTEALLQGFADKHGLYLDKKGPRPARRGNKVSWIDSYGNTHDLDFVLEKGGIPERIGTPVAFIEAAWRRYTKHSRNKAQEIQGAVLPLIEAHQNSAPFIGAVLAGVFTEGSLVQLKSHGFTILYFPYNAIVDAFRNVGIDAWCDEKTPDPEFARKVNAWKALSEARRKSVSIALTQINSAEIERFMDKLHRAVTRQVESIRVLPLHGCELKWDSVEEAISFVEGYDEKALGSQPIVKYEVEVRYNNRDSIRAQFADKVGAIMFLRSCQAPPIRPAGISASRPT